MFSFSDPFVRLERLSVKTISASTFGKPENTVERSISLDDLVKKGNELLLSKDSHTCCLCQRRFCNRLTLKYHLESFHSKSAKFFCDLCPKFYFNLPRMRLHMINMHSMKRFACNVCDYKSANRTSLKHHKLVHAAKVECPICKKAVSSMKQHMKNHKPKKLCPICQKMISYRHLSLHMKSHAKVTRCNSCSQHFDNKVDLQR